MRHRRRNRALRLAVLALGFFGAAPGWAAVTKSGDTTLSSISTFVGNSGVGTLAINGGSSWSDKYGYLGRNSGSTGTVTVNGVGSAWINSDYLNVGNFGAGTLTAANGGLVSNTHGYIGSGFGSTGTATISGAGSKWTNSGSLSVGHVGTGTLTIEAGGQVSSSYYSYLGVEAGSTGTAKVSGGARWTSGANLYVGHLGRGTMTIENSGQVSNYDGYISRYAESNGTVTVSGAGSTWTNGGSLYIGYFGNGKLTVADGGMVSAKTLYASLSDLYGNGSIIANGAVLDENLVFDSGHGTTQALTFGSGGTFNLTVNAMSDLGAGHKGSGSLRIADGVAVASTNGYLGNNAGSTGTATVSGAASAWTNSSDLYVGKSGSGTLTVEDGGQVSNAWSFVGSSTGSNGTVTVRGPGSTWTNSGFLIVGSSGTGTLTVEAGGQVSNTAGNLGRSAGSIGTATVSGAGSTWSSSTDLFVGYFGSGRLTVSDGGLVTAKTLYASPNDLYGNGTIAANGAVLDADLVFDSTHGTTQELAFGSGGRFNLTVNGTGDLGAGHKGSGRLRIADGVAVASGNGRLGHDSGAIGTATVSGAGSTWINSLELNVGRYGSGILTVADGGKVTARTLSINSESAVRLHVSGSDMLVLGDAATNGSVTNNGTVSFYADPSLPAGTYRPISPYAGRTVSWSGSSLNYRAFGGIWSNTAKTFAVAAPTALLAGASDTVASGERLLFTDPATGQCMGASFGMVGSGIAFSAAPMSGAEPAALAGLLESGETVLRAWNVATNLSSGEVLVSFNIGSMAEDLSVWRLNNSVWSAYSPSLLTYGANGIVSFTVSSFSGYAISGIEPHWQGDDATTPTHWSTAGNWSSQVQPGKAGQALFTQSGVNKSVDLGGGTCTAGLVRLASNDGYSIHNGTLVIDNDGKVGGGIRLESGSSGSHTISAAVQIVDDATITIESGKLDLSGEVRIAGGKTLRVAKAAAESLQISAITGGTGRLILGAQTVTKLSGDSSIRELEMDASARLDLSMAELLVAAGDLAQINRLVASGRSGGSWNGAGIVSSSLVGESGNRTLAVLAEGNGVKVMQTWAGDLTGDGMVDGADYRVLDRNWLADAGTLLHSRGNVDYSLDGITGDDYFQMDRSYLGQSSAGEFGVVTAAVPEPGTMGLMALAGSMLLARRRR